MRLFSIAFVALALSVMAARADESHYVTWGFESWQCGPTWFSIRLGNGGDVIVDGIEGLASAGPQQNAKSDNGWVRQTLTAITFGGPTKPTDGVVEGQPDRPRFVQSLDANLLAINIKQVGKQTIHLPVHGTVSGALAPKGELRALVENVTYTSGVEGESTGVLAEGQQPQECLDAEFHFQVRFHYAN